MKIERLALFQDCSRLLNIECKKGGTPLYLLYSNNYNFAGVYILHNKSKDLYYVGQGKQVLNRVYSHFTGKGNGDVQRTVPL
jgi:hypothetical protein